MRSTANMPYSAIGIFVLPILAYHMRIVRMTLGHIYNARDTGYRIQNELELMLIIFNFLAKIYPYPWRNTEDMQPEIP